MKYIAHRGLLKGPNKDLENHPQQIETALNLGFDVEVDLWVVNNKLYLGHDDPQYRICYSWLEDNRLWVHAKNTEALDYLVVNNITENYFWHDRDRYTLTSSGYVWANIGEPLTRKSVMVMPEIVDPKLENTINIICFGICSDYIQQIKGLRT